MSLLQLNNAINWAIQIANDPRYYYHMPPIPPYGYDCSSFVIDAFRQAGVPVYSAIDTTNMISEMTTNNTFTNIAFVDINNCQRGDILLKPYAGAAGHTCIYLGNGQIVHAANSSTGIVVANYYNNGYTDILRLTDQLPGSWTWHAKPTGEYQKEDIEAQENAALIYEQLSQYSWTMAAVAGFLANVGFEGVYNPWRWEHDIVISSTDSYNIDVSRSHGYGLTQFTPASKYVWDSNAQQMSGFSPNYSDIAGTPQDGRAQIEFINSYADYLPTTSHPQTYQEFKQWQGAPEDAASIWLHNYERPQVYTTETDRRTLARWWFDFLGGITPPTPTRRRSKLPIWLIMKITRKEL